MDHKPKKPKAARSSKVTSPSNIKRHALSYAQKTRFHKFNRVSKSFTDRAEVYLINWIKDEVIKHPSKGQTLK